LTSDGSNTTPSPTEEEASGKSGLGAHGLHNKRLLNKYTLKIVVREGLGPTPPEPSGMESLKKNLCFSGKLKTFFLQYKFAKGKEMRRKFFFVQKKIKITKKYFALSSRKKVFLIEY